MSRFRWITLFYLLFFMLVAADTFSLAESARGRAIDQQPMYGGLDRNSYPKLKKGDEILVAGVVKEWGTREKASQAFVEEGIKFYQQDDYSTAMKRFNQAWIIDPNNPDVFWGFSIIYHDEKNLAEAKKMIDKALDLNLSNPTALADAGRIYALFAFAKNDVDEKTKQYSAKKSDELYEDTLKRAPGNGYIYDSWANALYYEGDYARAWEKINQARQVGYTPNGWLINQLRQKMPEPKN